MNAAKMYPVVAVTVMLAIGVAYMIFLVSTWSQLQHDRTARYARIDEILDTVKLNTDKPAE